jgi:hypothetical protein
MENMENAAKTNNVVASILSRIGKFRSMEIFSNQER